MSGIVRARALGRSVRGATVWCLAAASLVLAGCRAGEPKPEPAAGSGGKRDTAKAIALNREAVAAKEDLAKAERLLERAIQADVFYGPAHNNLGIVYLKQRKYYQAAWKFQQAAKLMPRETEPLVNLGQVFETVGRLDDAREEYEKALQRDEADLAATAGLCRVLVRTGDRTPRTRRLLETLVLRAEDEAWRRWAQREVIRLRAHSEDPEPGPASRPAGPG